MPDPVKITVTEVREGDAIDQELRKIQALKAAAAEYEKKGMGDAAGSARGDAATRMRAVEPQLRAAGNTAAADAMAREAREIALAARYEKELGIAGAEALQMARQQVQAEEQITLQKREQAAQEKAGMGGGGNSSGLRGGRPGQVGRFLGMDASMAGEIGFAIAIGTMLQQAITGIDDSIRDRILDTTKEERKSVAEDRHRAWGAETTSSDAAAEMERAHRDEDSLDAHQNAIDEKEEQIKKNKRDERVRVASWGVIGAAIGLGFGPEGAAIGAAAGAGAGLLYNKFAIDPQNAELQKQSDMERAQMGKDMHDHAEAMKAAQADAKTQLGIAEAEARRDVPEMRRLQQQRQWMQEYTQAKGAGMPEWEAREMAGLAIKNQQNEAMQRMASKLIGANSGAGDISRAAQLADPSSDLRLRIDALHATVSNHLGSISEAASRRDFSGARRENF